MADVFPDFIHVSRTGLPIPATDFEIWTWAKQNNYTIIVSNDDDFRQLLERLGSPPKVVLLQTGNISTKTLEDLLRVHLPDIEGLVNSDDIDLLEVYA